MKTIIIFLVTFYCTSFAQANYDQLLQKDGKWIDKKTGQTYTGIIIEQYPSGRIRSKTPVKNGLISGCRVVLSQDGDTLMKRTYKGGQINGLAADYYPNGALRQRGLLIGDKQDGRWELFYQNGKPEAVITYRKGNPEGEYREYTPEGKLKKQYTVVDGQPVYEKNVEELVTGGVDDWKKKNLEKAVDKFSQAIQLNPTVYPAYLYRAGCQLSLMNFTEALNDYSIVLEADPTNAEALAHRAKARIGIEAAAGNSNIQGAVRDSICSDLNKALKNGYKGTEVGKLKEKYCK